MSKNLLVLFLVIYNLSALSQTPDTSRYFVYFKDKITENPYSVSTPEEFLTDRAIKRRNRQGIAITAQDLPVNPTYVAALQDSGVDVFFTSKWMNGALIQAHSNQEQQIKSLDFVDSLRLVAKGARLVKNPNTTAKPDSLAEPPSNFGDSQIQLFQLGADLMHKDGYRGQDMLIAVFDNGFTGINKYTPFQHAWDNDRFVATRDFVENSGNVFQFGSHGTGVLSIIGARFLTDSTAYYGSAYDADFIMCVTEDNRAENTIEEYNWLLAAEYADSLGADVINSSLGYRLFDIPEHNYTYDELDGRSAIISRAADIAASKGMIVVVSAGNEGDNKGWKYITSPADAYNVLAVGSVNVDFTYSPFSSVGPTKDGRIKPDVAAFGNGTAVMRGNGRIERGGGTSFAAPLIAGFAACIWQINPDKSSEEIIAMIKQAGHRADQPDSLFGYGVPHYAYASYAKGIKVSDVMEDKIPVYPNPFVSNKLTLFFDQEVKKDLSIKMIDPEGTELLNDTYKGSDLKGKLELPLDSRMQGVYYLFLQTGKIQKVVKLVNF